MGRINKLIVSIKTINWDNNKGLPWGTKWAINFTGSLNNELQIDVNHIGKANKNVVAIWAVIVNV
jgi:hypothetical protein